VGERRKSKDQDFRASAGLTNESLVRSCANRFGVRGSLEMSGGKSSRSIGSNDTEGRLRSSRASLIVKAACYMYGSFFIQFLKSVKRYALA